MIPNLYRLPWTKNDNPNGWLELTTFCQLKCPGCYRGLDKSGVKRINADITGLKKEVDFMKEKRNVQTISLSGGEPLLFPQLEELVSYIKSKNLRIKIYTNGLGLTKDKIIKLRNLGVTEFVIHIDKNQNRRGYDSEKDLNKLRSEFCNIFRAIKNINLGFIMPISNNNIKEIQEVLSFYKNNADIINLIVFTRYNDHIASGKKTKEEVSMETIAENVKKSYGCNPSSYLPKSLDKEKFAWLFFYPLVVEGRTVGTITSEKYSLLQNRYRNKRGKYFITIRGNKIKSINLPHFLGFFNALKFIFLRKNVYNQVILIIDSPEKINGKWDLCDGCPDPVLYKNKLVPSCLLERIKKGENIYIK